MPFSVVAPEKVDPGFRNRVNFFAAEAAFELGIPVPAIEYWRPDPEGNRSMPRGGQIACTLGTTISLTIDIPDRHLRRVVFHELRHVWQFLHGRFGMGEANEIDAQLFELKEMSNAS